MNISARLSDVPLGKTATIKELIAQNDMRRRLSDLGFIAGNTVTPLFSDFHRSITAFGISGTVIALRTSDSDNIMVEYE